MSESLQQLARDTAEVSPSTPAAAEQKPDRKSRIRIANPPPAFPEWISLKHAARWGKQRNAEFVIPGVVSLKPQFRKVLVRSMKPGNLVEAPATMRYVGR